MSTEQNDYSEFVEHPRFGRGPRFTRLKPEGSVYIGWHARQGMIPNTCVKADVKKQVPATFQFTHYYDLERTCEDCKRKFIFFADEQKYWYEVLQFGLDSDCIRCTDCRKHLQGLQRTRFEYEELFKLSSRTNEQSARMAECILELIEQKVFTAKQLQKIRERLNKLPAEFDPKRVEGIQEKLSAIEDSTK